MTNRFYMMCSRETVGNNASFHCHNGNGYSSDIDRAHVYTLEEAQKAGWFSPVSLFLHLKRWEDGKLSKWFKDTPTFQPGISPSTRAKSMRL